MSIKHELGVQFAVSHPEDTARALEEAGAEDAAAFLDDVPAEAAGRVVSLFDARFAAACVPALDPGHASAVVAKMPPHLAAMSLRHMDETARLSLLDSLEPTVARGLRRILEYPEGTAGAVADPGVLTVLPEMTVEEARKRLRSSGQMLRFVYVVDHEHVLKGVVHVRELAAAPQHHPVSAVMRTDLTTLPARRDLVSAVSDPAWRELDALPVVDRRGRLLGAVRHKTIRQLTGGTDGGPDVPAIALALDMAELYWTGLTTLTAEVNRLLQSGEGPEREPTRERGPS